jgi:predicted PurR-regulated permease PerM
MAARTQEFAHNPPPTTAPQEAGAVPPPRLSLASYVPSRRGLLAATGLGVGLRLCMLIAHGALRDRLCRLLGYGHWTDTTKARDAAGQRLSRSFLMPAIVHGTYGCAVGLGLFCLGLPYALLWGL